MKKHRLVLIAVVVIPLLLGSSLTDAQTLTQQSGWNSTGSLNTGRFGHTDTLLLSGKVLVVGGRVCGMSCVEFSSAELYDPATGTWSAAGNMSVPRHAHVAVRLPNGKVLVAGGQSGAAQGFITTWKSAEIYDPDTGTWSPTGSLESARAFSTATLLANGKVLVAGGGLFATNDPSSNTAELYDPATGVWSSAGTMNAPRRVHTATRLANGKVLISSGMGGTFASPILQNSSELYDPATGSWTPTGNLTTARVFHTDTLLPNGNVLLTGGSNFTTTIYDTAEIYDSSTGVWTPTGRLTTPRISHTANLLADGRVLVVAGFNNQPVNNTERSSEFYDPATGSWTRAVDLNLPRGNHRATLLNNGRLLVSGGNGSSPSSLTSAELLDTATSVPQITGASVSGKALFVEGQNFDEGAKVYLNDEKQKTANETATTLLRCKKAGKQIERGATVRLKVRNSDGTESAEFVFTRPA
jgi:Galactose oxidase, central domain/Kelch motif